MICWCKDNLGESKDCWSMIFDWSSAIGEEPKSVADCDQVWRFHNEGHAVLFALRWL